MMEYFGYDSFFATYQNGDYPNLKYIPGVRMEFVPRVSGDWVKDSCVWLKNNAKRIDSLFIYHLSARSLKHALTYKRNNPNGKIYLKLDGWPVPERFRFLRNTGCRFLLKMCSVVSTELQENADTLSRKWGRQIVTVANPINPNEIQDMLQFAERPNVILTVGRLGTKQKATEILLEAFAKIAGQIPDWTLKLAGVIEENMSIADNFYSQHPELKDRVTFTGEICDRNALMNMYRDSKIFAFPSRFESFGIALTEAMGQGCFAVVSRIPTNEAITEHFRLGLGSDVDDIDGMAENLLYACTHEAEIEKTAQEGREAVLRLCDLRKACEIIEEGVRQ